MARLHVHVNSNVIQVTQVSCHVMFMTIIVCITLISIFLKNLQNSQI